MKRYFALILCALAINAHFAHGKTIELTRAQAVVQALKNNGQLQAVRANIDAARGRLSQSGRLDNPTLDADYGNDFAFKGKGAYDFKVGISQKFPLSSRLSLESGVGHVELELAKLEYEQARRELAKKTEILFVDLLEKSAAASLAKENEILAKKLFLLLKNSHKAGEVGALDLGLAKTEYEAARINSESAAGEFENAQFALKDCLNTDSDIKAVGELKVEKISARKFSPAVLEARADYKIYSLAQKNVRAQIALIKAKRFDDIEVGIFYSSGREYEDGGGKSQTDLLGVSVSIPLPFNSYSGSIDEQRAMARRAELLAQAKEVYIKNQIRLYSSRAQRLDKTFRLYDTAYLRAASETAKQTESAYKLGEVSADLLLRVRNSLLQTRLKRNLCLSDQIKSAIDLKYALGEFENFEKIGENKKNEK